MNRYYCFICFCLLMVSSGCSSSSDQPVPPVLSETELVSVVAISRHGIRSPTSSTATMNQYTTRYQGFPIWPNSPDANTPDSPGNLSIHGQQNATKLGSWYRDFYAAMGLFPSKGSCPPAGTVYAYADVAERTIHTAQGYVDGMFLSEPNTGNCGVNVVTTKLKVDPYIATLAYAEFGLLGSCKLDTEGDYAAFMSRIGGSVDTLLTAYSTQLQMLETVTQNPLRSKLGTTIQKTPNVQFASGTLFDVADNLTESFELQYAQGMTDTNCATTIGANCVGWGVIPAGGLYDMTKLHVLNMDLTCSMPSFSKVGSTNLMWQLTGIMDQSLSGLRNPEVLAPVQNKFSLFVAHDENILAIAAFLGGVTWKAEGFQAKDPGPAGALVFELHKVKVTGQTIVRLYYVIASLDQMRYGTTLSLTTPPQRIPLAIPACGGLYDCPFDQFKNFIASNVNQGCIIKTIP